MTKFAPTDTTVANVPDWREDANSPHTLSAVQSQTLTLAGTFDLIRMTVLDVVGARNANTTLNLQLNGQTGTNYQIRQQDGSFVGSGTSAPIAQLGGRFERQLTPVEVLLAGNNADQLSGAVASMTPLYKIAQSFNIDASPAPFPLDTVTLLSANGTSTFDATVEIYGRNA